MELKGPIVSLRQLGGKRKLILNGIESMFLSNPAVIPTRRTKLILNGIERFIPPHI